MSSPAGLTLVSVSLLAAVLTNSPEFVAFSTDPLALPGSVPGIRRTQQSRNIAVFQISVVTLISSREDLF